MAEKKAKHKEKASEAQLKAKWGDALIAANFVTVPTILLEKQKALALDPVDVNIILHLVMHWWYRDSLPFPTKSRIAEQIGRTPSTVQRHIRNLQRSRLVTRITRNRKGGGQSSNAYDLGGLIDAMKPFAKEKLQQRKKQQAEKQERIKRMRPRLESHE
ncbi:MAG: hypothetical protein HY423_15955 [Candidatus Lambdaproteobacteria bacterium]|nr:hypothetical protein [Candidatus Lambdaproteobacteria bacterium]